VPREEEQPERQYEPAGQGKHESIELAAATSLKDPAGQRVQEESRPVPMAEKLPGEQIPLPNLLLQRCKQNRPEGQGIQTEEPI
jgi:hypothetical protein